MEKVCRFGFFDRLSSCFSLSHLDSNGYHDAVDESVEPADKFGLSNSDL